MGELGGNIILTNYDPKHPDQVPPVTTNYETPILPCQIHMYMGCSAAPMNSPIKIQPLP